MFVDDLFNKKTLTESSGGGSPWHSEPEQQQMDADRRGRLGRERNAGLDEPDNAPSGSAPTGNGVYEYTVPAGQESIAKELGLQQHRGHWVSRVPIQRANFQFGQPQFHKIPTQGVAEGSGGNWYIRVNGKILNDTKFKPVIFSSEDEARSHAMKLADKKRIPLSQMKLTKSWMDAPEQGVAEGQLDNPGESDSPVASAIVRRILLQRTDLLSKYGPEKVGQAVDEVADFVGDVDEIGSSDVSGWVKHVEQMLGNMDQGVTESQLDELSFKDIQKGANRFAKGATKFTKNVADTGAAVGNAAGALGGAIKQVGKTAIADPVAATYNATKSGLGKASNVAANTYGDLKKGVQTVGKAGQTVGSDIGAAGTAVGKGLQSVGRGVANVAGGTTGALGSVVGGATTGLGRAAASGFNAGVQNVGGGAIDKMQTNIMTPKVADIQKQIATKQDEIKALQATLAGEKSAAPTGGKSGIQTGATALIDPDTEQPYEKDKLAAMYGYKEPEAAAATTPAAPAAQPQGFSAANVMNLPGMTKTPAKPAAPAKTANFAGPGGYGKTTTGIKAPAAPSSPALAAPKLPSAPRVTAGGPTPAEKANLDKRIAAVAEALTQVERMLESVNSKKSAEMVKAYVDQKFTELGLRNTTECRNIMARVVQESAIRRRQHAKSLAK
jgi:hypothetical protein